MTEPPSIPHLPPMPQEEAAGRLPHWNRDRLIHRACPTCEADRPTPVCQRPDRLIVHRCLICGMVYLPEIPDSDEIATFYKTYSHFKDIAPAPASWWRKLLPFQMPNPYIDILELSGGLDGKEVCEVGCAFGQFLVRARKRGANVSGVELDAAALPHLRSLGIPATKEFDRRQRFDVICAFQLIEHLARPQDFVTEASQLLSPDGRLLLALPNGGELEKVGPNWVGFRVDLEHLNYFSVASLSRLLGNHGLYPEQFWEYLQPNLVRPGIALRGIGSWRARLSHLANQLWCELRCSSGTFVLCLLARKVAREPTL